MTNLRALIIGTGFAGQGHTLALRHVGVDVVGIVSRTLKVAERVAEKLSIPFAGVKIEQALTDLDVDIMAIATPGGAHIAPIMLALEADCHIYCDKPLAATAADARLIYQKARTKKVKTAYAASYRYQPYALLAKELIDQGKIGEPQEVECVSHFNLNPLIPFGWSHRLETGGGRLNNNFTHKLSIVEHVLGGYVQAIMGEVRNDMPKAPLVEGVHDFRTREDFAPVSSDEPGLKWADADAEWSYSVLARVCSPYASSAPVSASFRHSALQPAFGKDYIAFYGSEGAIHINGVYAQGPLYISDKRANWQEIELPMHIKANLPDIADDTLRNWTQLAKEFVNDIEGQGNTTYQTFKDGLRYQEIITHIREQDTWLDCAFENIGPIE